MNFNSDRNDTDSNSQNHREIYIPGKILNFTTLFRF